MMNPMATLPNNQLRDACAGCGESTAIGSVLFSDRRTLPDGAFLCGICNSKAAMHQRRPLTDEEVRQFINNGNMGAIVWGNNHF
jgi:hypothetical protein